MHHALLLGVGLTLTSLLLFIPALYMRALTGLELSMDMVTLMSLPILVLLIGTITKRAWLLLWLFPCSHLLALAVIPELSSHRLYQGVEGLGAFGVLLLVAGIYFSTALRDTEPQHHTFASSKAPEEGIRLVSMSTLTLLLSGAILTSFLLGIFLEPSNDRLSANITALAGLLTTWIVLGRFWYPYFIRPMNDLESRKTMIQEVLFVGRITRQQLTFSAIIVALTLSMLLVFNSIM